MSIFEQILPIFAFLANFSILEYKQCIPRIQKNLASVLARSFSLFCFSPLTVSLVFNKTNHLLHKAVLRIATLKFTEVAVFELVIMIIDIRIKFFA